MLPALSQLVRSPSPRRHVLQADDPRRLDGRLHHRRPAGATRRKARSRSTAGCPKLRQALALLEIRREEILYRALKAVTGAARLALEFGEGTRARHIRRRAYRLLTALPFGKATLGGAGHILASDFRRYSRRRRNDLRTKLLRRGSGCRRAIGRARCAVCSSVSMRSIPRCCRKGFDEEISRARAAQVAQPSVRNDDRSRHRSAKLCCRVAAASARPRLHGDQQQCRAGHSRQSGGARAGRAGRSG